ncbi:uncharacterized protein [Haliotis asinina]|uniref:uncharacterized protein n=1 Tax=Haliotis asinina TaxID=109174 RepID=UPI003532140F
MEQIMASETPDTPLGTLELESLPGKPDIPPVNEECPKTETILGEENLAFDGAETLQGELTPLTYVDFMPRCLGTGYLKGQLPEFAEFGTVVEQANQWLESMPQYTVWKCETVGKKLNNSDYQLDNDAVFIHMSSHGNNAFLMGLRLWLTPKMNPDAPVQKLSYLTVLPEENTQGGGSVADVISNLLNQQTGYRFGGTQLFTQFNSLSKTLEKLSRQFQLNPIAGTILNAETIKLLLSDSKPNPETTCWVETGRTNRLFVFALRIFYVIGEPAFETLGAKDIIPEYACNTEGMIQRLKFATYRSTVQKASDWLKKQQGIKVVNVQTIDVKVLKLPNGNIEFDSNSSGYGEMAFEDSCQFLKVLRIYYVRKQKVTPLDATPVSNMTSRLFVPVRKNQTGKVFESFSKTMQRVIAWLNVTQTPLLSMESVQYMVNPESWGTGVAEDRVDTVKNQSSGRYQLTCIRLYFPQDFEEPSPDLLPPTKEDEEGWMCIIS